MKRTRELENIVKGFANHRRIEILQLLKKQSDLSVNQIADALDIDFQNAAQHTAKLFAAGLIVKKRDINMVRHTLTSRGARVLRFLSDQL